ncbi:MAG TPA: DUF2218 domain-containing protein [Solirubrobacteraceae bacterium]|jgi:hypothetical protein|nr:DUF2218 domain-containing protein [Solirubrobacteraceae bacterium]
MPSSTAVVATAKPTPYLKQLCKHFGHKIEVQYTDDHGRIQFSAGVVELDATRPDALVLKAIADDAESLATVERVAGSHLERFGRRDELSVSWSADA